MTLAFFSLASAIVLWASAFVGIRHGLQFLDPGSLAFARFFVASITIGFFYPFFNRKNPVSRIDALYLLLTGFSSIGLYNLFLNYGEMTVKAGMASFLISQMPIMTIILAYLISKERISKRAIPGLLMAILGVGLIGLNPNAGVHWDVGILLILISALLGAHYSLSQHKYLVKYHPIVITAWIIWGGTILLCFYAKPLWHQLPDLPASTLITVIYLGIFPAALAYIAWCYALKNLSATHASLYLYTMPFISTLLGFAILHETPNHIEFIGGTIAMIGAFMSTNGLKVQTK